MKTFHIKLFSSSSGVRLVCFMSPHLNNICVISMWQHCTKIALNFSDDVQFVHTLQLKIIINVNIVYVLVKTKLSESPRSLFSTVGSSLLLLCFVCMHFLSGMLRSRDQHGLETTFLVSVSVSVSRSAGLGLMGAGLEVSYRGGWLDSSHYIEHFACVGFTEFFIPTLFI